MSVLPEGSRSINAADSSFFLEKTLVLGEITYPRVKVRREGKFWMDRFS